MIKGRSKSRESGKGCRCKYKLIGIHIDMLFYRLRCEIKTLEPVLIGHHQNWLHK